MKLLILLYGVMMPFMNTQVIEHEGMTFEATRTSTYMEFEIQAPTNGWVACGFNERSGLEGTHLCMFSIRNGQVNFSDRFVVAPGDHKPVDAFGVSSAIEVVSHREKNNSSHVVFRLPLHSSDVYHFDFTNLRSCHVLLAYSASDDFNHHSKIRTEKIIKL